MNYGFIIDNRKCIGCHACTVACKAEHEVPIGVNRTWVKYIEKGTFPDTRRLFSVMRCNHCADAPCGKNRLDRSGRCGPGSCHCRWQLRPRRWAPAEMADRRANHRWLLWPSRSVVPVPRSRRDVGTGSEIVPVRFADDAG